MSRNPIYIRLINSARWKKLRNEKLKDSPVYEECAKNGISTLASEIHHVRPKKALQVRQQWKRLMFDRMNLQSLCHACHAEIHKRAFSHSKESVQYEIIGGLNGTVC